MCNVVCNECWKIQLKILRHAAVNETERHREREREGERERGRFELIS